RKVAPVTLPPGRLRLFTMPCWIGSAPIANTIGIVVVADFAASAATYPPGWNTKTINPPRSQSRSVPSWGTSTDGSHANAIDPLVRAPGPETPDRASGGGAHARPYQACGQLGHYSVAPQRVPLFATSRNCDGSRALSGWDHANGAYMHSVHNPRHS